jgi:hypothetical protein
MIKTCTLAAATLAALAGAAAAQPLQPMSHVQIAEVESSAPKSSIRPERAVPHSLSFWPLVSWGQSADCEPGEPVDASTANNVRQHIEAAGFVDPRDLHKSCDNFWHGAATSNGRQVFLVVDPEGRVRLE